MNITEINDRLAALAENKNAKRSSTIIPGSKPILGARVPQLRKMAKQIAKEDYRGFLECCPNDNLEQQMLQVYVIGYAKDNIKVLLNYVDTFIPKIQDWFINDIFCQAFKVARDNRKIVLDWLMPYAAMELEYPQRVTAVMLLSHFLVEEYIDEVMEIMERLTYDGYYTKMGVAWCVATAYAKFPHKVMAYLKHNSLDDWTYNKSIQKMMESFRVTDEDKQILKTMKRK